MQEWRCGCCKADFTLGIPLCVCRDFKNCDWGVCLDCRWQAVKLLPPVLAGTSTGTVMHLP